LKEPRMPSWLPLSEYEFGIDEIPMVWRQYLRFSG
jgi:hypothetical protein